MTELRFYRKIDSMLLAEVGAKLGLTVAAEHANIQISGVASLGNAEAGQMSFLENEKYNKDMLSTKASAVIVPASLDKKVAIAKDVILLRSANPYYDYACLLDLFYGPKDEYKAEIAASSKISASATIGKGCFIGENVVINAEAEIGDNSIIEAGSFIGYGVKIGEKAKIGPQVSVQYAEIGDDVVILPGAKIGQDGFGFATKDGIHKKIFHIGRVLIGNNVEIGANSTIDRGSTSDTIIGDLCRIDNLVQVGHNVKVGRGAILVAQVGVSGSTQIGDYCALGGQAGIAGHLKIEAFAQVGAQAGVMRDVPKNGVVAGTPAMNIRDHFKQVATLKRLANNKITERA